MSTQYTRDSAAANNLGNNGTGGAQSNATALPANPNRVWFQIQNLSTNPLFVYFGTGATTSIYNFILKAGTGANDGTGGSFSSPSPLDYRGIITVAGTGISYVVSEL